MAAAAAEAEAAKNRTVIEQARHVDAQKQCGFLGSWAGQAAMVYRGYIWRYLSVIWDR